MAAGQKHDGDFLIQTNLTDCQVFQFFILLLQHIRISWSNKDISRWKIKFMFPGSLSDNMTYSIIFILFSDNDIISFYTYFRLNSHSYSFSMSDILWLFLILKPKSDSIFISVSNWQFKICYLTLVFKVSNNFLIDFK